MGSKKVVAILTAMSLAAGAQTVVFAEDAKLDGSGVKVGLLLGTGGLGDKNFNDMSFQGVTQAQEDFGIEFDYVEPEAVSDYSNYVPQFAQTGEYDLIIAVGTDAEDAIVDGVEEYEGQKFSLIDSSSEIPGVSTVQTKWQEQTFLAGVIAGLGTLSDMDKANDENVIGIILGMDTPELHKGVVGFTAGAKYVNPDVEVLTGVVESFGDPGKGKEVALSMYDKGADFIQAVAGASGFGIIAAAQERDQYVFGVGTNQNEEAPDNVVASSARGVDAMVYNEVRKLLDGTWSDGLSMSGIAEDALQCLREGSNVELPAEIEEAVAAIHDELVAGDLVPPMTDEELESWVQENQYQK